MKKIEELGKISDTNIYAIGRIAQKVDELVRAFNALSEIADPDLVNNKAYKLGYVNGSADKHDEDIEIIRQMRKEFGKDYASVKGDKDSELIIQSKVIALGQVLDSLGYGEEV